MGSDFFWGVATSAFQLEGSPHADWAFWDPKISSQPSITHHYHLYKKDLKLLKDLGVNAYRFSLEWSRIQPEKGQWNIEAIGHYQRIIDYLRQNDIEPLLTLHHFTHPAWFIKGHPWHLDQSRSLFIEYIEKMTSTLLLSNHDSETSMEMSYQLAVSSITISSLIWMHPITL